MEAQLPALGISAEATTKTLPLLTTRQLFRLKYGDPVVLAEYARADETTRRAILAELPDELPSVQAVAAAATTPMAPDTVEWFASPTDLMTTMIALSGKAAQPGLEPIDDILSSNPNIVSSPSFTRVRFKGGSEVGVVAHAWFLTRPDGSHLVVAGGTVNTTAPVDEGALQAIVDAAIELAAAPAEPFAATATTTAS